MTWTLQPPLEPGAYQYREITPGPVLNVEIVSRFGRLWIDLPDAWVDIREMDGEWRRR